MGCKNGRGLLGRVGGEEQDLVEVVVHQLMAAQVGAGVCEKGCLARGMKRRVSAKGWISGMGRVTVKGVVLGLEGVGPHLPHTVG